MLGDIPSYAAGVLYRTGPGGFQVLDTPNGTYTCSHWFDGFGQTHRFEILPSDDGRITISYRSRRHVDALIETIRHTGHFNNYTFAQRRDPCESFFRKVLSVFTPLTELELDNANVPVTLSVDVPGLKPSRKIEKHGTHRESVKSLYAKTDNSFLKEIDPETLEPLGIAKQEILHPLLKGPLSCAHAKSDPVTGDVFNYNLDLGYQATYRIFKTSAATGETEILATVAGPDILPAYLHSFLLTEDFLILCIWPSHLAVGGLKVLWEKNILDAMSPFDASKPSKWIVVDRKHGRGHIATFESPASFCFHTVNAWQEIGKDGHVDIVCDLIQYKNLDILHRFYYSNLCPTKAANSTVYANTKGNTSRPRLARFRLSDVYATSLDPAPRRAELLMTVPCSKVGDIPTMNPNFATRRNRYVYTIIDRGFSTFFDGLSKLDLDTQEAVLWDNPHGHTPGEAIFIPDPAGKQEDDGVLLSVVLDGHKGLSYLLCLDAKTMKERGRAEVECAIGFGFHGIHVGRDAGGKALDW